MEQLTKKYILSAYDEDTHLEIIAGIAGTKKVGILQMIVDGEIMAFALKDESDVNIIMEKLTVLKHEMRIHNDIKSVYENPNSDKFVG